MPAFTNAPVMSLTDATIFIKSRSLISVCHLTDTLAVTEKKTARSQ